MSSLRETLQDTANAIRTKTGKTDTLKPTEFAKEILSIPQGGGPTPPEPPIPGTDPNARIYYTAGPVGNDSTATTTLSLSVKSLPGNLVYAVFFVKSDYVVSSGWNMLFDDGGYTYSSTSYQRTCVYYKKAESEEESITVTQTLGNRLVISMFSMQDNENQLLELVYEDHIKYPSVTTERQKLWYCEEMKDGFKYKKGDIGIFSGSSMVSSKYAGTKINAGRVFGLNRIYESQVKSYTGITNVEVTLPEYLLCYQEATNLDRLTVEFVGQDCPTEKAYTSGSSADHSIFVFRLPNRNDIPWYQPYLKMKSDFKFKDNYSYFNTIYRESPVEEIIIPQHCLDTFPNNSTSTTHSYDTFFSDNFVQEYSGVVRTLELFQNYEEMPILDWSTFSTSPLHFYPTSERRAFYAGKFKKPPILKNLGKGFTQQSYEAYSNVDLTCTWFEKEDIINVLDNLYDISEKISSWSYIPKVYLTLDIYSKFTEEERQYYLSRGWELKDISDTSRRGFNSNPKYYNGTTSKTYEVRYKLEEN